MQTSKIEGPSPAVPSPAASASASEAAPVAGPVTARSRGELGWLLSLPLIAFIGVLLWYALRAEHRLRRAESTVGSGEQRATG